jgi:hypothetical protein
MEKTSAATLMAQSACAKEPTRSQLMMALAPTRASAAAASRRRNSRGRAATHARAQNTEHRQKIVDRVGQVNADDRIGRQSHVAQPPRNCAHDAVGLGVVQPKRAPAGEACAVEWIDQRGGVGPAVGVTAKQVVERQRGAARWIVLAVRFAEDHCRARLG